MIIDCKITTSPPPMSINTICWVDIPVTNLDRAIRFYSAVLGVPVSKEVVGPGNYIGMLPHAPHGVAGCLVIMTGHQPSPLGPLIYFSVEGRIDAAVNAVRTHGGSLVEDVHPIGTYGFRAIAIDSEGNRIALHSRGSGYRDDDPVSESIMP